MYYDLDIGMLLSGVIPEEKEQRQEALRILNNEIDSLKRKLSMYKFFQRMEEQRAHEAKKEGDAEAEAEALRYAEVNSEVVKLYEARKGKVITAKKNIEAVM